VQRGPHPQDRSSFAPRELPRLRAAEQDLSWLLSRGYPPKAAAALVGDRHQLRLRQRKAVQRVAAAPDDAAQRRRCRVPISALQTEPLLVDGYNVLLTVEAALSGGLLLRGRDGAMRDLTAMSHHYRRVATTRDALRHLGQFCTRHRCKAWAWYFDRPVSNSGRLRVLVQELVSQHGWPWEVHLVASPDRVLSESGGIVATADSAVLDRCERCYNLANEVVAEEVPQAWIVDLGGAEIPQTITR
jgi:hypothetical protein